ncbi:hypothetical protein HYPSUDRAFT_670241 [Hypholoma sublateritium FD-334 SS-4]|uniref:Uncharacterized protein n=1 Tax=Hypholoma sublateritium (strain FD-334 SS-4) TaxID=945553 RepID=A0A0D2L5T3_HYPSF|nr:hypothetical protein HYPSUDRAFT_670241 [Hypholoma sublateritium FD-334 SS-4]
MPSVVARPLLGAIESAAGGTAAEAQMLPSSRHPISVRKSTYIVLLTAVKPLSLCLLQPRAAEPVRSRAPYFVRRVAATHGGALCITPCYIAYIDQAWVTCRNIIQMVFSHEPCS